MHFAVDTERPTFAKVKNNLSIMFNYKTYKNDLLTTKM